MWSVQTCDAAPRRSRPLLPPFPTGLTTWGSNSQITHVKSTLGYGGPFEREEVAVPVWSHNPLVRQSACEWPGPRSTPLRTHSPFHAAAAAVPGPGAPLVMYHIGSGAGGPPRDGYCTLNATSPCGEQSFDQCALPPNPCGIAVPGFSW